MTLLRIVALGEYEPSLAGKSSTACGIRWAHKETMCFEQERMLEGTLCRILAVALRGLEMAQCRLGDTRHCHFACQSGRCFVDCSGLVAGNAGIWDDLGNLEMP